MTRKSLHPELKNAFIDFLEYTPAQRLNRNLRNMLLHYIIYEQQALPIEIEDLLLDLINLFRLLDAAENAGK